MFVFFFCRRYESNIVQMYFLFGFFSVEDTSWKFRKILNLGGGGGFMFVHVYLFVSPNNTVN